MYSKGRSVCELGVEPSMQILYPMSLPKPACGAMEVLVCTRRECILALAISEGSEVPYVH